MRERRREPRQAAEGTVELSLDAPLPRTIVATLVDISSAGFRARHDDLSLATGDRVHYSHAGGSGAAVVVWTRLFNGRIESGLYAGGRH